MGQCASAEGHPRRGHIESKMHTCGPAAVGKQHSPDIADDGLLNAFCAASVSNVSGAPTQPAHDIGGFDLDHANAGDCMPAVKELASRDPLVAYLLTHLEERDQQLASVKERLAKLEQRTSEASAEPADSPVTSEQVALQLDGVTERLEQLEAHSSGVSTHMAELEAKLSSQLHASLSAQIERLEASIVARQRVPLSNLDIHVINGIQVVLKTHMTQVDRMAKDYSARLAKVGTDVTTCIGALHSDMKQLSRRVGTLEKRMLLAFLAHAPAAGAGSGSASSAPSSSPASSAPCSPSKASVRSPREMAHAVRTGSNLAPASAAALAYAAAPRAAKLVTSGPCAQTDEPTVHTPVKAPAASCSQLQL